MTRVLRDENDFVVTYRYALLRVAEADPCQQRSGGNGIRLSPGAPTIVAQENLASLAHCHEPCAGDCDVKKQ
jgi:hypothetical protein